MPTVEFPRMGTIAQAAAESGVPAYRVRQLCKTGQVRSRCWNTESGKGGNNAAHSFSRLQCTKVWRLMQ